MNKETKEAKFIYLNLTLKHMLSTVRPVEIILMLLVCIIGMWSFLVTRHSLIESFENRADDVTQSAVASIELLENEMTLRLEASTIAINEILKNKKNYTNEDLKNLAKRFNITTIYLFGQDGFLKMTTGEKNQTQEHSKFQETFSIIDVEQCKTQMCGDAPCRKGDAVLNCQMQRTLAKDVFKNPNKLFTYPVTKKISLPKRIPAKWMFFYSKEIERLIVLVISGDDFNLIIEDKLKAHDGFINHISLTDNKGNIITEIGKKDKGFKISKNMNYKWEYNLENQNFIHSYILNIEFSKTEFNKHSRLLQILFLIVMGLIVALIFIIRNRIYIQNAILKELKNRH
jgi:hypothetical protein